MNARSLVLRLAALAACVFVALAAAAVAAERRPMTVEDLFTIEQLGEIAASPDGEWLAVVVKRARTTREVYKRDYLWENDHADVWLVPRRAGRPRNLTEGVMDKSGWWSPVWSPDGSRIALLSTRGGDNVRLWVWERATGTLRRLTEDGVVDMRGQRQSDGAGGRTALSLGSMTRPCCALCSPRASGRSCSTSNSAPRTSPIRAR
jgi:dipeptidyl aminopeptidase/acylaminoacyl peptidase